MICDLVCDLVCVLGFERPVTNSKLGIDPDRLRRMDLYVFSFDEIHDDGAGTIRLKGLFLLTKRMCTDAILHRH